MLQEYFRLLSNSGLALLNEGFEFNIKSVSTAGDMIGYGNPEDTCVHFFFFILL